MRITKHEEFAECSRKSSFYYWYWSTVTCCVRSFDPSTCPLNLFGFEHRSNNWTGCKRPSHWAIGARLIPSLALVINLFVTSPCIINNSYAYIYIQIGIRFYSYVLLPGLHWWQNQAWKGIRIAFMLKLCQFGLFFFFQKKSMQFDRARTTEYAPVFYFAVSEKMMPVKLLRTHEYDASMSI